MCGFMLYVSWVIVCQSIEWIREDYVCVFMKLGKGKRIMRSNRRETWGSLNLPPWLSTSYIVSIYFFSLCRLQIVFIYYGNLGNKHICGEVMSNFLQERAESCSPLLALIYHLNISVKMMLWCHDTPCIVGYVCMLFSYEKITLNFHEMGDF